MSQIAITISVEDLQALIKERDSLRARIQELEREPLRFSLENLARKVADEDLHLTPRQRELMMEAIKKGV